jgi:hypothetical protein
MDELVRKYLSTLTLGEPQHHKNFSVVSIMRPSNGGPLYQNLKEALTYRTLLVTETGPEGSVPELKVANKGDVPVLLLDGEELTGAKQNRVLNTTILIDAHTEIVIPVSCTEQGRWSYTSNHFDDSDVIMASQVRSRKSQTVSKNLQMGMSFRSNQGEVWDGIREMAYEAKVAAPTGAMKDVFNAREDELAEYIMAIECRPNQTGMIAFIRGAVAGFDSLSCASAYRAIHAKLVKSYAMEAVLLKKRKTKTTRF